ncbi:MAG: hypothetical protein AAF989_15960 [Planctomycetota bacterium]
MAFPRKSVLDSEALIEGETVASIGSRSGHVGHSLMNGHHGVGRFGQAFFRGELNEKDMGEEYLKWISNQQVQVLSDCHQVVGVKNGRRDWQVNVASWLLLC